MKIHICDPCYESLSIITEACYYYFRKFNTVDLCERHAFEVKQEGFKVLKRR